MKWPNVTLDRVAAIYGGSTPSRDREEYWNGSIPWLTPTDLPMPGEGIADVTDTAGKITEKGLAAISAQLLPVGTVLFSSRATIGKLGISRVPLATNQGFANFIPKEGIDAKYLAYCLLYHRRDITALAGSTTFKEVTKTSLKKFRIPLPPLSEQRRIVEILDQADALRKKRAEADAKAARILPALFYKMFGDPVVNPMGWPLEPLDAVTSVIYRYPTFYGVDYVAEGVPVVRISDIGESGILNRCLDRYVRVPKEFSDNFPLTIIKHLDIVMAVRGDTTGKMGLVPPELEGANLSPNLIRISPLGERIAPLYLLGHMLLAKTLIGQYITNTAKKSITASNIKTLSIMVPDSRKQMAFHNAFEKVLKVGQNREIVAETIDGLFFTLLNQAFTGELTARWREAHMKELVEEMELQTKYLV